MERKRQSFGIGIQKQLETDSRLILEYGVPSEEIPYKKILTIEAEWILEEDAALERTRQLVEEENRNQRPSAFVTSRFHETKEGIVAYEVWGYAD